MNIACAFKYFQYGFVYLGDDQFSLLVHYLLYRKNDPQTGAGNAAGGHQEIQHHVACRRAYGFGRDPRLGQQDGIKRYLFFLM